MTDLAKASLFSSMPMINADSLEQTADTFYMRMSSDEQQVTQGIVKLLETYMDNTSTEPHLIAGVGGILRREHPAAAHDIDLAVAGFKYSQDSHSFSHVEQFTYALRGFFDSMAEEIKKVSDEFGELRRDRELSFSHGSGPFAGCKTGLNTGYTAMRNGERCDLVCDIESFGLYNSKGLKIHVGRNRPIDIQFSFNTTPQEWRMQQVHPGSAYHEFSRDGKSDRFLYAVLHERK
jgi:hypothetical protein